MKPFPEAAALSGPGAAHGGEEALAAEGASFRVLGV